MEGDEMRGHGFDMKRLKEYVKEDKKILKELKSMVRAKMEKERKAQIDRIVEILRDCPMEECNRAYVAETLVDNKETPIGTANRFEINFKYDNHPSMRSGESTIKPKNYLV